MVGDSVTNLGQEGETLKQGVAHLGVDTSDEVAALGEHVEQVEYAEDDVEVARGEQGKQVFYGVVQVT